MPLLTIFSAPKPFTNPHIAVIQHNAIKSWTELPDVRVILLGDEEGLAEATHTLKVEHIKDVPRSPSGAPLMDAMFNLVRAASPSQLYCIVNADIILLDDFVLAAQATFNQRNKFVLMGQRWDADITQLIDFTEGWQSRLIKDVKTNGQLHRPAGSDYFLFPAACYTQIPAFVIGRAGWDNWMIFHALKQNFAAIDATHDITIVHQNHDYAHLPGGKPHYDHPETAENIRLAGGRAMTRFTLLDTNKRLINGKVLPQKLDSNRFWRKLEAWALIKLGSSRLSNLITRLRKFLK